MAFGTRSTLPDSHPIALTDKERALILQQRAEAQAEEHRYRANFHARLGVTPPVKALFVAIHYGFTIPPDYLPARAAQEDYNQFGPTATEEECRVALMKCLNKGWLQVIDEPALAKISSDLRAASPWPDLRRPPGGRMRRFHRIRWRICG